MSAQSGLTLPAFFSKLIFMQVIIFSDVNVCQPDGAPQAAFDEQRGGDGHRHHKHLRKKNCSGWSNSGRCWPSK
jgi:hypothetical protein